MPTRADTALTADAAALNARCLGRISFDRHKIDRARVQASSWAWQG